METAARVVGWLPLIPLLPALGFVVNGLVGRRLGKKGVAFVALAGPLSAFALAVAAAVGLAAADRATIVETSVLGRGEVRQALARHDMTARDDPALPRMLVVHDRSVDEVRAALERSGIAGVRVEDAARIAPRTFVAEPGTWIAFAGFRVPFRFVIDRLSAVMVLVVLGVGSLIHIYSLGYMAGEGRGGFARYFAYLNLFTAMMLVLVTAGDLILLFVGWEGVGLSSYLLIGFEYREGWKADAGVKAFVVNRVGDLGFILGAIALATCAKAAMASGAPAGLAPSLRAALEAGEWTRLDLLGGLARAGGLPPLILGVACLLLFLGATGKSAQIPLFVWLPDAMAGPTPVSALIHAATMVTAGVYMLARMHALFEHAFVLGVPVLLIVAVVGAATAFLAATAALAQDDVKKVLAYSTVSQLGYMFVGAGAGAFSASIFHLTTHAFFKALLFLAAGALIHATGTQDLKKMGGLREKLPVTFKTMAIGVVALAGIPPFAGFFSKDAILAAVLERGHEHARAPFAWQAIYAVGLLTAFLTAFYSVRMLVLAFFGKEGEASRGELHDAPPLMGGPLVVLAALATLGGLLGLPAGVPGGEGLAHFLSPVLGEVAAAAAPAAEGAGHSLPQELVVMGVSLAVALVGAGLARSVYLPEPAPVVAELEAARGPFARIRPFLAAAWRVDELYRRAIVQPLVAFSSKLWAIGDDLLLDRVIVDGAGRLAEALSLLARAFQTGRVPRYAAYLAVGVLAALLAAVL